MAVRQPYRFTVEDYHRMAEAGILGEDDRVELIEGEIVEMPPIGSPHGGTVKALIHLFSKRVGDRALVAAQDPVRLSDFSEPQPDLMLLRRRPDFYRDAHPTPADVLLLVEVADTSAAYDRSVKVPLYAHAGIPEYWLVDLERGVVEVHRSPAGDRYGEVLELAAGARVAPVSLADVELDVGEILGS
ncbi:MAG TPA: Uma2 family endonuclease [Actinomycetota bacterium]|jgi:Uma2 family endonuclease|nr:Uma2 family endonuclease [Actinomycetota bacterium]